MILAHAEDFVVTSQSSDYVGSPMYSIIAEHRAAVFLVILAVGAAWLVRWAAARGSVRAVRWVEGYRRLTKIHRLLAWLLAITAAVHAGLVLGHEPSGYSAAYAIGALGLSWALVRLVRGRSWKRLTRLVLVGSIVAYAVSAFGGEPPDQVGIATKLVELAALAIAVTPAPHKRLRQVMANAAVVVLFLAVAMAAWVGAFSSGGGHHLGDVPSPGVLLPTDPDRPATAAEEWAATDLHRQTQIAIAKYQDPAVAEAAGFDVDGMWGRDFHATNAAYEADSHILDPTRPENLVYAMVDDQPVLLGAMFTMPDMGQAGPSVGGPLTVWHAHDHICIGLPGIISGLQSPFGTCPIGSITIPVTNEMIHVWTLPGVPEPFGDIEDKWLDAYLADLQTKGTNE